ncbi:AAA family ATPase [Streptococcus suis]|uniref:AAA family ATPase n=1 Tax=Streptococcus parasuis TaxID=1501662 RepID=UPI002377D62A|nr:AAA family ATPase [Streptococcus parasuis]MDG3181368.1 AAA family ATPase [Streptococcus suis]WDM38063.1 AAA family ATPase [Streptococcus parasuis]
MQNTFLKRLIVTSSNKSSEIEFTNGLNIITGPSNIGKTCIVKSIDYLTGSDTQPFSSSTSYDTVILEIQQSKNTIKLERKIGSNEINVSSESTKIKSGIYRSDKSTKDKPLISTVWLQLLEITPPVEIAKNSSYHKQQLGFRTFSHAWIIHEEDMIRSNSILLPKLPQTKTAFLSSLLFLLYGKDFSLFEMQETSKEKNIRKSSVRKYINSKINEIYDNYERIQNELSEQDDKNIEEEINQLSLQLTEVRKIISKFNTEHKVLLEEISTTDRLLSEQNILLNRFTELQSQYQSDINRLNFIIESHNELADIPNTGLCPVCDNKISIETTDLHVDSINSEITNLFTKSNELEITIRQLNESVYNLNVNKKELLSKKTDIESKLNKTFLPNQIQLKQKIEAYKSYIESKHELEILQKLVSNWENDIESIDNEKSALQQYTPLDEFNSSFWTEMTKNLKEILTICSFDKATFTRFDRKDFDITVAGIKKKDKYGKGYIAYLNTVTVLALRKIFYQKAKYRPFFHIFDTPLLGLDEGDINNTPESMQIGLFEYFKESSNIGQIIVIENSRNLPDISYDNVNIIEFTKNPAKGRYGFLEGVSD